MITVTTWEGMQIPFPDHIDQRKLADLLLRATAHMNPPAFRFKGGRLHAAEIVGCIQTSGIRVNVLPKLDTPSEERDRAFLINMLTAADYLKKPFSAPAHVKASSLDPLEMLIFEVASEISSGLFDGVPRRYEEKQEELSTVRGRIDFQRLATKLPSDQIRIPVRYSPLHANNKLTVSLKGITLLLHRISKSNANRLLLASVLSQFDAVPTQKLELSALMSLRLTTAEKRWARAISVAKMLLSSQSPDPTFSGQNEAFSLLFPLQHLFERAMRNILLTALAESDIQSTHHSESRFLYHDENDGSGVVRLRPDYLLKKSEEIIAVADAKWKRASDTGRAYGMNRDDLYQLAAYLSRYQASHALVFLPKAPWMSQSWTARYRSPDGNDQVHLIGIDIERLVSRNKTVRAEATRDLSLMITRELIGNK
ncbi:McrC family protein [Xanthomonas sacchari]|uniref:McrC family protein n=1 Tax=Xanthomonas sacchari TaxID=56458 RepID=UPI003B22413B